MTMLNQCSLNLLVTGLACLSQAMLAGIPADAQDHSAPVGLPFDLQGFIDQEIRAGAKRIVVPPGQYRVAPRDRQHLLLRELKDIRIVADGVEMICTETTRAITISHCTNLTLRGLKIDYDPLPYSQGRITAISADHEVYDVRAFRRISGRRNNPEFQI